MFCLWTFALIYIVGVQQCNSWCTAVQRSMSNAVDLCSVSAWQQGCTALYSSLTAGSPAATLQSTALMYNVPQNTITKLTAGLYCTIQQPDSRVASSNSTKHRFNVQCSSEHYNKLDSRVAAALISVSSTNSTKHRFNVLQMSLIQTLLQDTINKVAHSKPHFNIVFITSTNLFNAFYELYTAVCYAFHQIEAQAFSDIALFRPLLQLSSKQAGFRRRFLGKLPCFQFLLTRPFSLFSHFAGDTNMNYYVWIIHILHCERWTIYIWSRFLTLETSLTL